MLDDEKLKRICISGKIHKCVAGEIIEETHEHEGTYVNLTTTWQYVFHTPYWWPT